MQGIARERTIGFVNGVKVKLSDHASLRSDERFIDHNFILKLIGMNWEALKDADYTPRGFHIALQSKMGDIYDYVPKAIDVKGKYTMSSFGGGVKTKRIVPRRVNLRNLSKRSDDNFLYVSLDKQKHGGEDSFVVVTAFIKKTEPHITENTLLYA